MAAEFEETAVVETVKVAVELPAATVTVAGTVALARLEVSETEIPPVGADPLRVTVPVELVPPITVFGESETVEIATGLIVRVAVTEVPAEVAVITAEELDVDDAVLMVNVPVVEPDATVTVEGTVALELLDERVTTVPPLGAALVRVTVPVEEEPATTVVGERVSDDG